MATTNETQGTILEAITVVIEKHHHDWTVDVLRLAEAHAWLEAAAQPHGGSLTPGSS